MSTGRAASRRTVSPLAFVVVTVAVMTVHTLARDRRWRYEWLWATYQYHFGVLLLGPMLCGIAAWVGGRSEHGRWVTRPAGRPAAALRPLALAVASSWAAYVAAWAVPASFVVRSGTTDRLDPATVASFGPPLLALAAYVAIGFAAGARYPGWITPPVAAVATFGLTLAGWITGAERLVRVGGSGLSMVTLRPVGLVQVAQMSLYGTIALATAGWATHHLAGVRRRRLVVGGPAAVAALIGAWLVVTSSPQFDHPPSSDACVAADSVSICAARPYEASLRRLSHQMGPALIRLRAAGGPVGDRVHVGATVDIFEPSPPADVVAAELFDVSGIGRCWAPAVADDITNLATWMRIVVTRRPAPDAVGPDDPTPSELSSADPTVQDAWAAQALRRVLAECPSVR